MKYKIAKARTVRMPLHATYRKKITEIKYFEHSSKTSHIQVEIDIETFKQMIVMQRICVADMRCMNTASKQAIQHVLGELIIS